MTTTETIDFAVVTRGRTGSTALVHDLNTHPNITCHQELFTSLPFADEHDTAPSYEQQTSKHGPLTIAAYLSSIRESTDSKAAQGFKILISQFDERANLGLWEYLLKNHFAIVYLIRDPLYEALSGAIANARGLYHLHSGSSLNLERQALKRSVQLDPQWVCDEIKYSTYTTKIWSEKFAVSGLPHIIITYESYCHDKQKCLAKIHQLLKVMPIHSNQPNPFQKVTSKNVWDDVINRDEVIDALVKSGITVS